MQSDKKLWMPLFHQNPDADEARPRKISIIDLRPRSNEVVTRFLIKPKISSAAISIVFYRAASARDRTLNCDAIETGFEIALAAQADNLIRDLAFIEEQQRGDRANAVFSGQALLFVDIDLANSDTVFVFVGQFSQDGSEHFARSAPLSPEIHEHGNERIKNFRLKILLSEYNNIR
jgi:hypothetical protein